MGYHQKSNLNTLSAPAQDCSGHPRQNGGEDSNWGWKFYNYQNDGNNGSFSADNIFNSLMRVHPLGNGDQANGKV